MGYVPPAKLLLPTPRPVFTRFRRLRLGVILLGVLVLLAFTGTCAYDLWRSHRHTVTATHREISNLAGALAINRPDQVSVDC